MRPRIAQLAGLPLLLVTVSNPSYAGSAFERLLPEHHQRTEAGPGQGLSLGQSSIRDRWPASNTFLPSAIIYQDRTTQNAKLTQLRRGL